MTINLDLTPEMETHLAAAAQAKGMSLEAYVKTLIEHNMRSEMPRRLSQHEFRAVLDALAAHSDKIPSLPDKAFIGREDIYQDHD